jgi:HPt (histidine-containing phosphotransfer) domain-containing protein
VVDSYQVLDMERFRDATLDDADLMREILEALIEDTSRQLPLLSDAIDSRDGVRTRRLAHYSKGACANVGARAAAEALERIEKQAACLEFAGCMASLHRLADEVVRLRDQALPSLGSADSGAPSAILP